MSDKVNLALCYFLDSASENWAISADRFVESYKRWPPGADHQFYLVLRGFRDEGQRQQALHIFNEVRHLVLSSPANQDELGDYRAILNSVPHKTLCFLEADCEILAHGWLGKLAVNLAREGVGMVGVAGSYRSLGADGEPSRFPNVSLFSDVLMIHRALLLDLLTRPEQKVDLTELARRGGYEVLVVGRNGRGYAPRWWPRSETYCRGTQSNLLISTRHSRAFSAMPWNDKLIAAREAWGIYLDDRSMNLLS